MKKLKTILALTLLLCGAKAEAFVIDGLAYGAYNNPGEVMLVQRSDSNGNLIPYKGNIVIPETVTYSGNTYKVTYILNAFNFAPDLESVVIPGTVTGISKDAFVYNQNLKKVRFEPGDEILKISSGNFGKHCTNLTEVEIGRRIEGSGETFKRLPALSEVTVLAGCTTFDVQNVFSSQLQSLVIEDASTVLELINIPWNAGGGANLKHVYIGRALSESILINRTSIETVEIGDMVESLPSSFCWGCAGLKSVKIGSGLKEIGDECFSHCEALETVESTANIVSIGNSAFSDCKKLTSFNFSENLTTIGNNSFYNCELLTDISFGEKLETIGYGAFTGCKMLTSLSIPASTTEIGGDAFKNSNLTQITICDGTAPIDFGGILPMKLESIYIGRPMTERGVYRYGFAMHNQLKEVTIGPKISELYSSMFDISYGNLQNITILGPVDKIPAYFCNGCQNLETLTLSSEIKVIEEHAFSGCKILTVPDFGGQLTEIGSFAFSGCENIATMTFPASLQRVGQQALASTCIKELVIEHSESPLTCAVWLVRSARIESMVIDRLFDGNPSFNENMADVSVHFGDNITKVEEGLFSNAKIKEVTIGKNVTEIEKFAFNRCKTLKSIDIPGNVETIGYESFLGSESLESVTLHEGLKRIDSSAFFQVFNLSEITIPSSMELVTDRAFACGHLKSITILDSDKPLEVTHQNFGGAFDNDGIEYLYIGRDIKNFTTPFASFSNDLKNIEFGPEVTSIADGAFYPESLESVKSASLVPPAAFDGTFPESAYRLATLYVPKSAEQAYAEAPMWKNFVNRRVVTKMFMVNVSNASAGGVVKLNGEEIASMEIEEGETLTVEVLPDNLHKLKSLIVNGEDVTTAVVGNLYTIDRVASDVDVSVEFAELAKFAVTVRYDHAMGSVTLNGEETDALIVMEGNSLTMAIAPAQWHRIASVTMNGRDITAEIADMSYVVESVDADVEFVVEFIPVPLYSVTATFDSQMGEVLLNGVARSEISLHEGEALTVEVRPARGYEIASVKLNGREMADSKESVTFTVDAMTEALAIEATFAESILVIGISDAEFGSFVQKVRYGQDFSVGINCNNGWMINTVTANGVDITDTLVDGWITLTGVEEDMQINVTFESDDSGITPNNSDRQIKVYGRSQAIDITGITSEDVVNVYDTSGIAVYHGAETHIPVKGGIYIVEIGGRTFKVLVGR